MTQCAAAIMGSVSLISLCNCQNAHNWQLQTRGRGRVAKIPLVSGSQLMQHIYC